MTVLYALDLIGTAAFAASGAWAAVRSRMDLFGVLVLGLVTAVGGGTLRDLLVGDLPPFSLQDETYLYISIVAALAVFTFRNHFGVMERQLLILDAVGLGTFVVIGTTKGLDFQLGFLGASLMGVMTGTAGGVIRDILANRVPLILRKEVYASACLVGSVLLVTLEYFGTSRPISALFSAAIVIVLRLLAIQYNWSLPRS